MAGQDFTPRKQRTREHVIADQSLNHLERFIIDAGYTPHRLGSDYGYDLAATTFDEHGYPEPDFLRFQLKASDELTQSHGDYVFDVDVRDYNLWVQETLPVIFVLYEASRRRAFWLHFQEFFQADPSREPKKGAKTVRVRIPTNQKLNRRSVVRMRGWKNATSTTKRIKLWDPS
jgi:hypothetical protein